MSAVDIYLSPPHQASLVNFVKDHFLHADISDELSILDATWIVVLASVHLSSRLKLTKLE